MKHFFSQKKSINYPYFLLILLCILTLSFLRFLPLNLPPWFFFYSFLQGVLEVGVFVFLAHLAKDFVPRFLYFVLPTLFFMALLIHYTNFTMVRLLDVPLSYLLKFFAGQGISHVVSVFQAINMNQNMMILIGIAIFSIPILGIIFYCATNWFAQKKRFPISLLQIIYPLVACGGLLLAFEWIAITSLSHTLHAKYQKTLPLGTTLLAPPIQHIVLSNPILPPFPQEKTLTYFENISCPSKPNIYLFVIETFRQDFITADISPSLARFGQENIQFPFSFANANSTQHSWFAIFHSLFPYHWTYLRNHPSQGSLPLQLLKQLGYKIHVYSSADLRYFEMDTMIFGPQRNLADQIIEFAPNRSLESWEKDALVMQAFEKDIGLEDGKEGNLFLFFFDATHSEYSFPEEFSHKFTPITQQIDYLTLDPQNIEPIKNRYRNSVAYVDSLLEKFIATLKQEKLYDKSIIAITGDHGEEFFEEGSLFHGTHLNAIQTNVPIFFKFQNNTLPIYTNTATHVDIFPSILHFLTQTPPPPTFDGESIFLKNRWPYRLAILQNGAKAPSEFTIEKENYKIHARFTDPENLYETKHLEVISLTNEPPHETLHQEHFPGVFEFLNMKPLARPPEQIAGK